MVRAIECWLVLILMLFCPQCIVVYGQESAAVYWFDKGNDFWRIDPYEEAIENYDKAIEIDRRFSEVWVAKGIALVGLERYNESIDCFDEAIKINPEYAEAWHNKGLALAIGLGRYEEAILACNKAISLSPQDADFWNGLGVALVGLGKYDVAIDAFDRSLELNPSDASSWKTGAMHSAIRADTMRQLKHTTRLLPSIQKMLMPGIIKARRF